MIVDIRGNVYIQPVKVYAGESTQDDITIAYNQRAEHVVVSIATDVVTLGIAAAVLQKRFDEAIAALDVSYAERIQITATIKGAITNNEIDRSKSIKSFGN